VTRTACVGNDVVDLEDPRTRGRHEDRRFVARVLGPDERGMFASEDDPFTGFWAAWAAKEAAYKVASKLRGSPPVFAHAAFAVRWSDASPLPRHGHVSWEDLRVPVEIYRHESAVHAIAAFGGDVRHTIQGLEAIGAAAAADGGGRLEDLLDAFTEREADAIHSVASALVRIRARRALADALRVDESALEIVCDPGVRGRRPPRVLLRGQPAPADVSLSHHGAWIAWAVLLDGAPSPSTTSG